MTLLAEPAVTPFATLNCLPAGARSQVVSLLNLRLAEAIDLEGQCKQAHWNVKGPQFIALHKLFDEIHDSVEGYVDLIAERIVQLGGTAMGTVRIAAKRSELDEYPAGISDGSDHVKSLSMALAGFGGRMQAAIAATAGLQDAGTADLCTEVSRGIDQWLWFVEAHTPAR